VLILPLLFIANAPEMFLARHTHFLHKTPCNRRAVLESADLY
jgi:hypothetical protein